MIGEKFPIREVLLECKTVDRLRLPGLLFYPKKPTKKAVIFLHGNGSNSIFYKKDRMEGIAAGLLEKGIAFFPFNNRGAHLIKTFTLKKGKKEEKINHGMTYELIKDCVKDIDAAVAEMQRVGFRELYLVGHSSGANKICVYDSVKKNNPIKKYVLLAPGDDTGIYFDQMGPRRFGNFLSKCEEMIKKGRGRDLAEGLPREYFISWQSLYDTINPDGLYNCFPFLEKINKLGLSKKPLFSEFKNIKKPTLSVFAESDFFCFDGAAFCMETMRAEVKDKSNFKFALIKGAEHGFEGKEKILGKVIASWL